MKLLSTAEVARRLGIHHYSVNRLIRRGLLQAQKIGKTWAVEEEDAERLARSYRGKRGRPPRRGQ